MRRISLLLVLALSLAARSYGQQVVGSCTVLPADNIWNTPVDTLPVLATSASMVSTIGANTGFHADFGSGTWNGGPIGIPFIAVAGTQTKYPAMFYYPDESDPGPYAIPLNAPIEGGSRTILRAGDRCRSPLNIASSRCRSARERCSGPRRCPSRTSCISLRTNVGSSRSS